MVSNRRCGLDFCSKEIPDGRISRYCSDFCALKAKKTYGTYRPEGVGP